MSKINTSYVAINQSVFVEIFPGIFKLGKVIPVFKGNSYFQKQSLTVDVTYCHVTVVIYSN